MKCLALLVLLLVCGCPGPAETLRPFTRIAIDVDNHHAWKGKLGVGLKGSKGHVLVGATGWWHFTGTWDLTSPLAVPDREAVGAWFEAEREW